jgi:putative FmdB family regulatory protein
MPLYEYRCHRCEKTFELRQKFAEAPLTVHEGCGGEVERIIFPSALQFKGSGFYVNDYGRGKSRRTNGSNANAKSESKNESKDSKSESRESKSESKSEPKVESKPESKGQNQSSTSAPSPEK